MTWLWLKDNPDFSSQAEDRLSKSAKGMFYHLTRTFRVVDDSPPYEEAWVESVRDPWDLPIWSAAVRAQARFVVTYNLKDAPPAGKDKVREFDGVFYVSPQVLLAVVDELLDPVEPDRSLRATIASILR